MSVKCRRDGLAWVRSDGGFWGRVRALLVVMLVGGLVTPVGLTHAGELPVVGVSTGDASRATVVEMLNTLSSFEFDVAGYQIVPPLETAARIDETATRQRQLLASPEYDAQVDDLIREGWESLERGDVPSALALLQTALEMVEYGQPARVRLGSQERWYQVRLLMTAAHLQNPAKQGGDIAAAKAALQPVAIFFPDRDPREDGFGPVMVKFYDEAVRNLYLLPHGRLSVETAGGPFEVFVNGLFVGESPVKDIVLPVGDYSVEVGRADKTGRIHQITIPRGKTVALNIDPLLEQNLHTEGFPIYEAAPGQDPATTALFLGQGVSRIVGSRYALVIGAPDDAQSGDNKTVYIALVDAENGHVVRERTTTVPASDQTGQSLANALDRTFSGGGANAAPGSGGDADAGSDGGGGDGGSDGGSGGGWPAARWLWIGSSIAAVGCFILGGYYISDGVDKDQAAQETFVGSPEGDALSDEANDSFLIGGVAVGFGVLFTALAVYFMYDDFSAEDSGSSTVMRPDWQVMTTPILDAQGQPSGMGMGFWMRF